MDFIANMLSDEEILSKYKQIDKDNKYPSSHGMKHIFGVLDIADRFGAVLDLSEREMLILKTCEVLHDIGQVGGIRQGHPERSAEFAKSYLPAKNIFLDDELKMIYSAIETHDEYLDYSKFQNHFSWIVALIDKLDFSKSRLEEGYREKFGYVNSEDIERLDFELNEKELKIIIKLVEGKTQITPESLYNRNLTCKAMTLFQGFAEHFGFKPRLFLESEELDLNKFNKQAMMDR